jgi:hypothetical protein
MSGGWLIAGGIIVAAAILITTACAWLLIWALNALFGLHIEFNVTTCIAVVVILLIIGVAVGGREN